MTIRQHLVLSVGLLGCSSAAKPNILYIMTDQQRTDTLGCYGSSFAHSPNIDKLAADGVLFTDAYTASPVCSPSRNSILTGVHVPLHGIYENGMGAYRDGLTPYFQPLKEAGYHTALIGKTHFKPVPKNYIDHLDIHTGNDDKRGPDIAAEDFLETYLVNQTMDWIDSVKDNGPWYVYLGMVSPHGPNWVPPGPWASVYDDVELPPINYQVGNIAALPWQTRMLLGLLGKEESNPPAFPNKVPNMTFIDSPVTAGDPSPDGRYNYYAQAAYVDAQVGRMIHFLNDRSLKHSTLVIFASDHGSELFDHGINNDKHNFLDASLRVPLIMRYPAALPAGIKREFATTLDVTATILSVAGATVPSDYQGFDLITPIAAGEPSPRRVGISTEYRGNALVTPTWKLAFFHEQGEGRLWNRVDDPSEQNNLFDCADAETSRVRDGLLMALLKWRSQQDPIGYMKANTQTGGGPTAILVGNHTRHLMGIDAEIALQEAALRFEPATVV